MAWSRVVVMVMVLALVGCKPTIDGSSEEAMQASVAEVRETLSGSELDAFDEAMVTLAFRSVGESLFDPNVDGEETTRRMLARLDGKNAKAIIAEAEEVRAKVAEERAARELEQRERERTQALAEIQELEEAQSQSEKARQGLASFTVERSRFRKIARRHGREQPRIELHVTNGTDHAVSRVYFDARLTSPGRSVAWLEERFNYAIPGGLEPGESATWNLEPNRFSDWGDVQMRDDMVLTVSPVRLDGADGQPLFEVNFGEKHAARLEALRAEYGE